MLYTQQQEVQWQHRVTEDGKAWQLFEVVGDLATADRHELLYKISSWAKSRLHTWLITMEGCNSDLINCCVYNNKMNTARQGCHCPSCTTGTATISTQNATNLL